MAEEKKEEKKLGPGAIYHDHDKTGKVVTVGGVMFTDGKPVNVVEAIGEDKAQALLKRLSGNKYFEVQGAEKKQERKPDAPQYDEYSSQSLIAREQALRAEGRTEEADKLVEELGQGQKQGQQSGKEPPPDYQAPEQATLESPSLPRGKK